MAGGQPCEPGYEEYWQLRSPTYREDFFTPEEVVREARKMNLATPDHKCELDLPEFGHVVSNDFIRIAEELTEMIHEAIDEYDEEAFDQHALADLREAFTTYSDYMGLNEAKDPYHA